MLPKNLAIELRDNGGAPMHAIVSFGRVFLHEMIRLGVRVAGGGGVSMVLLTLAVLIFLTSGQPNPSPNPNPSVLLF